MPATPSQTLRMERVFDCSPEEMWAAWTEPRQYAKWISPFPGLDAEVHEMDARPGGRIRFTMVGPDGTRYPEEVGVFEVVDPPRELVQHQANDLRSDVFAGHPMRMRARFDAVPGGTRVVLEVEGLPAAVPHDAARGGFGACFDKLETHLGERARHTLRLERTLDASPEEVWDAWTDPAQYAKWLNPAPFDLVIHEFDVRPGGRIRFDMPQPDGNPHPQSGVFHVVEPYRRLVSGEPDKSFLVTVLLEPVGPRTRMQVIVNGIPPDWHSPATQGWGMGFDKLAALLAARKR